MFVTMKEKEQALFKYARETLPTSDKEILGLLVLSFIFTLTSKVAVPEAKIQEVIFGFTIIFTYFFIIKTFYNVYKKSILFEYLGPLLS